MEICGKPFYSLILSPFDGVLVYAACCPSWLKPPYNDYFFKDQSVSGVLDLDYLWNSKEFVEFRSSILDGSYRYCDENVCPHLSSENFFDIPEKAASNIKEKNPYLNYSPIQIAASLDNCCNLCCPSCRKSPIRDAKPGAYQAFIDVLKSGVEDIVLNCSGELFYNPYLLKILRSYSCKDYPSVKAFTILTNGILLNRTMWFSLSDDFKKLLKEINISVDSFSEKTYNAIRPGGSFITLQKNLKIISSLRRTGELNSFNLVFILQKKNYKELVDIIKGSLALNPDGIHIKSAQNWGHHSEEYFRNNIMLPLDFQDICSESILEAKKLIKTSGVPLTSDII